MAWKNNCAVKTSSAFYSVLWSITIPACGLLTRRNLEFVSQEHWLNQPVRHTVQRLSPSLKSNLKPNSNMRRLPWIGRKSPRLSSGCAQHGVQLQHNSCLTWTWAVSMSHNFYCVMLDFFNVQIVLLPPDFLVFLPVSASVNLIQKSNYNRFLLSEAFSDVIQMLTQVSLLTNIKIT